jgi:hypothetical protein
MSRRDTILQILDLARWAPSGDNTQPWRFEIVDDNHIAVHGFDTRDHVLYDFDGHASHMAHGALLETIRIAATGFQLEARWALRPDCSDTAPIYDVEFTHVSGLAPDPLLPFIRDRVVQRRPMSTTPLSVAQREALAAAPGPGYEVQFLGSRRDKLRVARLLWDNAYIRLTCPEAFEVHREVIEWGVRYSNDRIPEGAVGIDPITGKLMKWVMQSWARVQFFNRYLLGTIAPRIQLDVLPALGCAAHVVLRAAQRPVGMLGFVHAGVAMQRLWLTATAHGLHLQPAMTPVIFRWYVRAGKSISTSSDIDRRAQLLAGNFERVLGASAGDAIPFFCRVGRSKVPSARSLRKSVDELLLAH